MNLHIYSDGTLCFKHVCQKREKEKTIHFMSDITTNRINYALDANWYKKISPKISVIYLKYQPRNSRFPNCLKDG